MRTSIRPALLAGAALVLLTACSSSATGGPDPDPTFPAPITSIAAVSTPGKTTLPAAAPSIAAVGSSALPGVPAVSGATDMSTKPVLAPGSGPAPTGLVVRDLVVGSGTAVSSTATVNLKYVGALYSDATVFDASWGSAGATGPDQASFPLSGVIAGFAQGLVGMKVGGRREIVIPAALGYGSNATGNIPANSTIVFVVDMMKTAG